jgi:hypothetical protein
MGFERKKTITSTSLCEINSQPSCALTTSLITGRVVIQNLNEEYTKAIEVEKEMV